MSILPVFSKVLERIMYNRVYNHLDSKGLLYEKQFGFQRNNSTEHAILQLIRDITSSFKKGGCIIGVFIDLSKAFDTVDHQVVDQTSCLLMLIKLNGPYLTLSQKDSFFHQGRLKLRG